MFIKFKRKMFFESIWLLIKSFRNKLDGSCLEGFCYPFVFAVTIGNFLCTHKHPIIAARRKQASSNISFRQVAREKEESRSFRARYNQSRLGAEQQTENVRKGKTHRG